MKRLFALFLAVISLISLGGCQTDGSGSKPLYGVILTDDTPYLEKILEGFRAGAEELGAQVVVEYAATVEEQISAMEALQEQGVQAIAIRPAETVGLEQAFDRAAEAGIPVLCVDMDAEGSKYFVDQANFEMVSETLLNAVLDLSGGQGEFAVIGSDQFSGMNVWVYFMGRGFEDGNYENLTWAATEYCSPDDPEQIRETTRQLLADHPDLKVICCPDTQILKYCVQTIDESTSSVRVTGLSTSSVMAGLLGPDQTCPYFFLWNPVDIGYCCAYAAEALIRDGIDPERGLFTAKNGNVYTTGSGGLSEMKIYVGPPYQFTADNYVQWIDVY